MSTMANQRTPDSLQLLRDKVFKAAEDNQPQVIQDCLASLHPDVVKDILHHCSEFQGLQTTPLIVAAWKGHLKVVEVLVHQFNVDVDQKVPFSCDMSNALISAVCQGHMDIVKVLVRKGCDVSVENSEGHTPVFIACCRNDLDVLKYLVENGAEIGDISSHGSPTNLMTACCKENREMVSYLLSKGADPNKQDDEGRTALHQAAENGSCDIITLLLHQGAMFFKDKRGRSPLMEAALKHSIDAVKVFLRSVDLNELEKIEGLELLGATLAQTRVDDAFICLKQAMEERWKNPTNVLFKPQSPLPTLSNVQESQTLEELQTRLTNEHLFRLECLAILSRILGPDDVVTVQSFKEYSDVLRYTGHDAEATAVFFHGMKAAVKCFSSPANTTLALHLLLNKFVELLQNGILTFFSDLGEVMESILDVMEKYRPHFFETPNSDYIWLCFILLALKVSQGQEEGRRLQRLVERFTRLTSKCPVLHTAVCFIWNRPHNPGDADDLPFDLLIPFLLHCGADVNVKDNDKNTALHLVAFFSDSTSDHSLFSRTTKTLLTAGALVGVKNSIGQTPLDLAAPWLAAELRKLYPVSLKSLAATAVVTCNIPYTGEVPKELEEFIAMH